jgi:hypothetical protein
VDGQAGAAADVFFIHPTTFYGGAWNADVADAEVNRRTDTGTIRNQATAFNACCRVFAPRYRQAVLGAFMDAGDDGRAALDLAYTDVRRAFEHYLSHWNHGRPFVIASHSQGSRHAARLLKEAIAGSPAADRFVAAYVAGTAFPLDEFTRALRTLHPCAKADDVGCVASWSTYGEGGDPAPQQSRVEVRSPDGWESTAGRPLLCTNPLRWEGDGGAPAARNLGSLPFAPRDSPLPAVVPAATGAACANGTLFLDRPSVAGFDRLVFKGQNFHNYDFNLFWANVRENAVQRVKAFVARGDPKP